MCLSVHCISYARVFQLPIYDGRPLSRMSWIIFFGICGIKRFLSGNLSCLSFYTVLSSLSPLFYGQSHVSPRHFALSLLVDNGADHLKPDNIFLCIKINPWLPYIPLSGFSSNARFFQGWDQVVLSVFCVAGEGSNLCARA